MKEKICLVALLVAHSVANAVPFTPAWVSDIFCQYDVSTSKGDRTVSGTDFRASFKPRAVHSGGSGAPWGIPDGAFKNGDELTLSLPAQDFAQSINLSFRHLDAADKLLEVYIDFYPNDDLAKFTNAVHYRGRLSIDSDETQEVSFTHNLTDNGSKQGAMIGGEEVTEIAVHCGYKKFWSQENNESCRDFEKDIAPKSKDVIDPTGFFECTAVNKATPKTNHMPIFTSDTVAKGSTQAMAIKALKEKLCSARTEFKDKQFYCLKKGATK